MLFTSSRRKFQIYSSIKQALGKKDFTVKWKASFRNSLIPVQTISCGLFSLFVSYLSIFQPVLLDSLDILSFKLCPLGGSSPKWHPQDLKDKVWEKLLWSSQKKPRAISSISLVLVWVLPTPELITFHEWRRWEEEGCNVLNWVQSESYNYS